MKNVITFIFFALILISKNAISQVCGGGILKFNIYTLNGQEIKYFNYDISPVSKELLKEFYKKIVNKENLNNPNYQLFQNVNSTGLIIREDFANEIIDTANLQLNERLKKMIELSKINQSGKIKSSLLFKTFETINFPIVLKISVKEKTIYILGNYFGGCDREASLLWNNGYGKLN